MRQPQNALFLVRVALLCVALFHFATPGILAQTRVFGSSYTGGNEPGLIFSIQDNGTDLQVHKKFDGNTNGDAIDGGSLIKAADGDFYGIATHGGANRNGVIFKLDHDDYSFTKLFDFGDNFGATTGRYPWASLLQATDGKLYGMTNSGGASHMGVLFRIDTDGTDFEAVVTFSGTNGAAPGQNSPLIQASNGYIYGVAGTGANSRGVLFRINLAGTYEKLLDFNGDASYPVSVIQGSNGSLYGLTRQNNPTNTGAIFRCDLDGSNFTVLHQFNGTDGIDPVAQLVEDGDGILYGSTQNGGSSNFGTIFSIALDGSDFGVVLDVPSGWPGSRGIVLGEDQWLYLATTFGGPANVGGILRVQTDGSDVETVVQLDGSVGASIQGPIYLEGDQILAICDRSDAFKPNIIELNTDGTGLTEVFSFHIPSDGQYPSRNLLLSSTGYLYGTTRLGGEIDKGVIFRMNFDGTGYTVIHEFAGGASGQYPRSTVSEGRDGYLYGAANESLFNTGLLYRIRLDGTGFQVIHHFTGGVNGNESNPPLASSNGKLYGTAGGGTTGNGFAYRINTDGTGFQVLKDFVSATTGSSPTELTEDENGYLYWGTSQGGTSGGGTLLKMSNDGNQFLKLKDFSFADGQNLSGRIAVIGSGYLASTAFIGGSGNGGVVFKIKDDGSDYIKIKEFGGTVASPQWLFGGVTPGPGDYLWGFDYVGGNSGQGSLYKMKTDGTDFSQPLHFTFSNEIKGVSGEPLFVTAKEHQSITFAALSPIGFKIEPITLLATSDSGLPVTYEVSNTAVATVSGNTLTFTGTGSVTITASQAGDNDYFAALPVQRTLVVSKGDPHLGITSPVKGVVGSTIDLTSYNGGSTGVASFSVVNGSGSATISGNTLSLASAGTVTVTLNVAADANFNAASVAEVITIRKPVPAFSITSASGGLEGANILVQATTGGSQGAITYSVVNQTGSASVSGNVVHLISAGSVMLKATLAENAGYGEASSTQMITIRDSDNEPAPGMAQIWGVAAGGGTGHTGSIFRMNADGTGFTEVHEFTPHTKGTAPRRHEMVLANDGMLYGTTLEGGNHNSGVLFRLDPSTYEYTKVFDFTPQQGAWPWAGMTQLSDGWLWGTTARGGVNNMGVLYRFNPVTLVFEKKYDFDVSSGTGPTTSVMQASNGKIYGTTIGGGGTSGVGSLYEFDPTNDTFSKKKNFSSTDGYSAKGRIIEAANGMLYGVTSAGGGSNGGTIFEFDPATGVYTKKVTLNLNTTGGGAWAGLVAGPNGKYFIAANLATGFANGAIIEYVPGATTAIKRFEFSPATGTRPFGAMVLAPNGKMYGLTTDAGAFGEGTLYEFDPLTFSCVKKMDFETEWLADGTMTVMADGRLFGNTGRGGPDLGGVLFEFRPETNVYRVHEAFGYPESYGPSRPVAKLNGSLFGAAVGPGDKGSIFEYNISSGQQTALKFLPELGFSGALLAPGDGFLYGFANGDLTKYDPATSVATMLIDMNSSTGSANRDLWRAENGIVYGTRSDTDHPGGHLFEYVPGDDEVSTLHTFVAPNRNPLNPPVIGPDGQLYGFGQEGTNSAGFIYRIDPQSGALTNLYNFVIGDAFNPLANPVFHPNGKLYGTTAWINGNDTGKLFEFDPVTGQYQNLVSLPGFTAYSSLVTGSNGKLFGLLTSGGSLGGGMLYSYDPSNNQFDVVNEFPVDGVQSGSLVLFKLEQAITFDELGAATLVDDPISLDATASSGLPITYASSNTSVATISGNLVTIVGEGSTTITASQGGNFHFEGAVPVTRVLEVVMADQAISFDALPVKTYGDSPFPVTATSSSGLTVTFQSSDQSVATISGNTVTIVGTGSTTITASQPGDNEYEPALPIDQVLEVGKANQAISFGAITTKTFGDEPFEINATAASGLPVAFESGDETIATVIDNVVRIVSAGTVSIIASQDGNELYNPANTATQNLVIAKAENSIDFPPIVARTFGDQPFTLEATATSNLPIAYVSSDPAVASVSGNVITVIGAGDAVITANQSGDGNYKAAEPVSADLIINKRSQSITFAQLNNVTIGDPPIILTATASSGLPVNFVTPMNEVSISGNIATLMTPGTATIIAEQLGNSNFLDAPSILNTFCINPPKPVITMSGIDTGSPVLTSSGETGNQWYLNGTAIEGATGRTLTTTNGGSVTVKVTIRGCTSATSNPTVLTVTGLELTSEPGLRIDPNPVGDFVFVEVMSEVDEVAVVTIVDVLGRDVMVKSIRTNSREEFAVGGMSPGAYLIRASTGNHFHSGRILKK